MNSPAIFKTVIAALVLLCAAHWVTARAAYAGQQLDQQVSTSLDCAFQSASQTPCPEY